MRYSALLVVAAAVVCGGATNASLDEEFIRISAESCVAAGRLGATPEEIVENCECMARQAADYASEPLKRYMVENEAVPIKAREGMFIDEQGFLSALLMECPEVYALLKGRSVTDARNKSYGSN